MKQRKDKNGFALIMVVVIIMGLVVIAVPFLSSMRLSEKNSKIFLAKIQAREIARGAKNLAVSSLYNTHESVERENFLSNFASRNRNQRQSRTPDSVKFNTPDFDSLEEYDTTFPQLLTSNGKQFSFADPTKEIWSVHAQDEQAKINLNSAAPWLIANIMGVTELTEDCKANDTEIKIADTTIFFADSDPQTVDGFVRIDSEYIAYCGKTKTALTGCMRGIFMESVKHKHEKGSLVHDGRAFKIAEHRILNDRGHISLFTTPASVRDIANWTKLGEVVENILHHGLNLDKLKKLGITEEDITKAGIDIQKLTGSEAPEEEPDTKELDEFLKEKGIDVNRLKKIDNIDVRQKIIEIVKKYFKHSNYPKDFAENITKAINKQIKAVEKQQKEETEELKEYLPEAFKNLPLFKQLSYIEVLTALELNRIENFITTYSWRAKDWSESIPIVQDIPSIESGGNINCRAVAVPDTKWFSRGTIVRIKSEDHYEYATVAGRDRRGRLVMETSIKFPYIADETTIQAMLRHPININTCDDRVLKALLVGLEATPDFYTEHPAKFENVERDFVTPAEAEAVIKRIRSFPPASYEQLSQLLSAAVAAKEISPRDAVAIYINAINPNEPSLIVSTAPFCFASHNIYTIEAAGIVNNPAGTETARHTTREVVQISPPQNLTWALETQQDFCAELPVCKWNNNKLSPVRLNLVSFPDREANKLDTRSNLIKRNISYQFPSTNRNPAEGDMRIDTGNIAAGNKYTEHFHNTHDGQFFENGYTIPTEQYFPIVSNLGPNKNLKSIAPGYFTCWFKPDSSGSIYYFLDTGVDEFEDRIVFYYDGSDVVFMVCDATLERTGQVIRAPLNFSQDTWYHLAACWKGSRHGDLAVFIDRKAAGDYDCYTRLCGDISKEDYEIVVEDASRLPIQNPNPSANFFPVIDIDGEAMEVCEINGNKLTLRYYSETNKVRATCRGTMPISHSDGAVVTVWGYSNPILGGHIPVGGATIAPNHFLAAPIPSASITGLFANGDIKVASTDSFPPDGILLLESQRTRQQEKVHYNRISDNKFINCTRGIENTTQINLDVGDTVTLISLRLSGGVNKLVPTEDYYESGYIQLNNEWIGYSKAGTEPYRSIYMIIGDQSRGHSSSLSFSHGPGTKVIPVFRVRDISCGKGDLVTVLDDSGNEPKKAQMTINRATDDTAMALAAFTDFLPRSFEGEWARVLKFPSGELPTTIQENVCIGGRITPGWTGKTPGTFDEISISYDKIQPYGVSLGVALGSNIIVEIPSLRFRYYLAISSSIDSVSNTIPLNNYRLEKKEIQNLLQHGGLIKIDDEIIGVCGVINGSIIEANITIPIAESFSPVVRGLLGTTPAPHPEGASIYVLPYPRAAKFTGELTNTTIPIQNPGEINTEEGFVQVARQSDEGEILPFRYLTNRYLDINNTGVFRSAFGSPITGCNNNDLGIFLPFRYFDLYEKNRESKQGVYYYAANTVKYAYFKGVTWDADTPEGTVVKVQVRIDGEPAWDSPPTNKKGGIFEFTDPEGDNEINVAGERVEVRVYLTYLEDAYRTDAWKKTPVIRSISLEYVCPIGVFSHELQKE
ncbi:MAG: hypothetical protein ABIH42_11170 [Planctomycetota bacterium]